ncbi:hypothetical protein R6Z07M_009315 [Ovis aries]
MKKICKKGELPLGSSISQRRDRGHHRTNFQPWYHIQDRGLRKIHKAASVGNVAKVHQVLLLGENGLNDRDKRNRSENRLHDFNFSLEIGELCTLEMVFPVLQDDLTPLLLGIHETRGQMVEFLVKKGANIHAVDKKKRTALMLAVKYESANVVRLLLQQGADIFSKDVFGWTAEEYAVISGFKMFPNKPGVDLGPTSNDEVLDFKTKVSDGWEEAQDLLRKNHTLRLEIDALKRQHREKEENYSEDMGILKGKNDDLQKAIKLSEETLTKTVSHCTRQLNALTAEDRMLTFKLENEKESKQRLETEVKSYCSRLAAASRDHDQGQTSQRDLELAFQRARDEWLCLQDKMKSDMANLNDVAETFSQQPSIVESRLNKLKIKLQHMRDDLREKTSMLERVQRD